MLRLARQTIHSLNGGRVASEILVRLQVGSKVLPPPMFMRGASAKDWHDLDMAVLKRLDDSEALKQESLPTFLNISPGTLENDQYLDAFCGEIERQAGARSGKLVVEIPEKSGLSGRQLLGKVELIEAAGVRVAIDDLGREYACQRRLESHPWAYCKIDLGAVAEQENLDWLNKAIEYSRRHGIQLIMEKIESQRDLDVLSPVKNSAWFQGYCFSRPELVRGAQDTLRKVSGAEG